MPRMMSSGRYLRRVTAVGVGLVALLVGCAEVTRSTDPAMPVQRTPGAVSTRREGRPAALPRCSGKTVIVKVGEELDCDVSPPQTLVVLFEATEGSDAELERLDGECLDMGGKPSWERGEMLFCRDVDY